jgi:hypothetical protein
MRMRVLLGLVLIVYGCDGTVTGPTPPTNVAGRVIDFGTGAGVARATVTFGYPVYTNTGRFVPGNPHVAVADANGLYNLRLPSDQYTVWVNDRQIGSAVVTPSYLGDLFVQPGLCVSRYGTVSDAVNGRPIANVTVSLAAQKVTTDENGWYRIDLGCFPNGQYGFNTTFIYFSHPRYADASAVVGRGVAGVIRLDTTLRR